MEKRPFIYPERCMSLCPCWQPDGTCSRADEVNMARPQIFCRQAGCERVPGQIEFRHKPECYWSSPRLVVLPVIIDEEDFAA